MGLFDFLLLKVNQYNTITYILQSHMKTMANNMNMAFTMKMTNPLRDLS